MLSDCFYSMTHWSFPSLDVPWSTGCHYDHLFSPSDLCDPQVLCLDCELGRNESKCKGAVLKQTSYSDHGDFRKLISVLMFLFWFCSLWRTLTFTSHLKKMSLSVMYVRETIKNEIYYVNWNSIVMYKYNLFSLVKYQISSVFSTTFIMLIVYSCCLLFYFFPLP